MLLVEPCADELTGGTLVERGSNGAGAPDDQPLTGASFAVV